MTVRTVALVLCAASVAFAGCTAPGPDAPPSTTPSTKERPAASRPKDRDKDAVLAALRQLDLCAVVEQARPGARSVATGPFECRLAGTGVATSVTAVGIGQVTRTTSTTRTIGGAKAYVSLGGNCDVYLPVSFTMALEFTQGPTTDCADVTNLAAVAAKVLASPESVRDKPVWDACSALAEVLGDEVDKTKLLGNGLADCTNQSREPTPVTISFADELPPSQEQHPPRKTTIGGTQAQVYDLDETCAVYWRQRPFDSRYTPTHDYQVALTSPDCDKSKELAESLMSVLEKAPTTDATPQRPLLYRPDEADSPYPGGCAYVDSVDPASCEPYTEVAVPDDPAKILSSAFDDANVQCALSVRAVGAAFGTKLMPVADSHGGTECLFVEPEKQLQLTFSTSYGKTSNEDGSKPATVAGHPGYVTIRTKAVTYELSTTTKLDGESTVTLIASTGPANNGRLASGTDHKAETALADIVRAYFS